MAQTNLKNEGTMREEWPHGRNSKGFKGLGFPKIRGIFKGDIGVI